MNATLQCLSNCKELTDYLINNYHSIQNKYNDFVLTYAYANVINNLFPSKSKYKPYYKPIYFKNVIGNLNPLFKEFKANDSKDLLIFILERMHQELKIKLNINNNINQNINLDFKMGQFLFFFIQYNSQNCSIIAQNFYGVNETTTQCLNCNHLNFNFNVFNFIIFPLEEARKYNLQKGQLLILNQRIKTFIELVNNAKQSKITLKDCFEYNQKVEFLQGENSIFCNHCHQSSNAYMYPKLTLTPKILCIVLNRGKGNIYQVKIDFPQILDMTPFVYPYNQYKQYELIGVITHLGESGEGGHFVSICKSIIDKEWYFFNDQTVTKSSFNDALNKGTPYILFYHAI